MRKSAYFFLLLSFIVSFQAVSSTFASKRDSILLTGLIFNNNDRITGVVVNIYYHNELWKVEHLKRNNRLNTYLPKNAMLTIEITAPNYHAKRFMFNTSLPKELKIMPRYQFDIDLFKEEELAGVENNSILDFPVGLVEYDEKKKIFLRNKKYTKRMKKAYLALWKESQVMVERSGIEEGKEEEDVDDKKGKN